MGLIANEHASSRANKVLFVAAWLLVESSVAVSCKTRTDRASTASVASVSTGSIPVPAVPPEPPIPSASSGNQHPFLRRADPAASRAARDCMKAIAPKPRRLSGSAIGELGKRLTSSCLANGPGRDVAVLLSSQSGALPFVFALSEGGRPIQLVYHCSDVCPDQGGVDTFFYDVTERECCDLNQVPRYDFAWGGYLGCIPREITPKSQRQGNPCDRIDRSGPDPGRHPRRPRMANPYTVQFRGGQAVIDWTETNDHVVIADEHGKRLMDFSCTYPPGYHSFQSLFAMAKAALLERDSEQLAKLIHFPLRVNGGSIPALVHAEELGARFDKVFTPAFIEKVRTTEASMMSCRKGTQAKLGNGLLVADSYEGGPLVNAINQ